MKFSIVTPVFNGERHIAETIESVLSQEGDFEIDYVVADGASTDRTLDIVRTYEARVRSGHYPARCKNVRFRYFSERDNGMYDAVQNGFARTEGDIMAYINADDRYLPGAFAAVALIFARYPDVEWAKGVNATSDEHGTIVEEGVCFLYRQDWLQKGIYGRTAPFVQQDSVFWRRNLWDEVRPRIGKYRLAGDYALWKTFAARAPLWSVDWPVSVFRKRPGQLSEDMALYRVEQERVAPRHALLEKRVALYFTLVRSLQLSPREAAARVLYRAFFPLAPRWWYIGFDADGGPHKERALGYAV